MEKINNICWIVVFCIVSFIAGYIVRHNNEELNKHYEYNIDSTKYNIKEKDSIKYNIKEKDTIIYRLKIKYEKDVEEANSLNDVDAVILFKELVTR